MKTKEIGRIIFMALVVLAFMVAYLLIPWDGPFA